MQALPVHTTCSHAHTLMLTHGHTTVCTTPLQRASLSHVTLPVAHMQTDTHLHTANLSCASTTHPLHTSTAHSPRLHLTGSRVHTHTPPTGGHCPFESHPPFCTFQAARTYQLVLETPPLPPPLFLSPFPFLSMVGPSPNP